MKQFLLAILAATGLAATVAPGRAGAVDLVLENGWTAAPFATANPAVFIDDGIVHLKGAIANGATAGAFTLPAAYRPAAEVYVVADLCTGKQGRLWIRPSGAVTVETNGDFPAAQCFTSLDGVRFARDATGFTPLALVNGWGNTIFGTSSAAGTVIDGMVHLKGAISDGTNALAFTLPVDLRPATNVFVPVNLCSAKKGRLLIETTGAVQVFATSGVFGDAQCFTSLDGVAFAAAGAAFSPLLVTVNGWTAAPFATSNPAVSVVDGIVRLKGAIANGTSTDAFVLPFGIRPSTNVYVSVDLCNGAAGRLNIAPSGLVSVQAASGNLAEAQCFTSLDGVSFVLPPPSAFTDLAPENGWTNGVYATANAAVVFYDGVVHFRGAVTDGATAVLTTLPVTLRPDNDVYVAADVCEGRPGRVLVQSNGLVTVHARAGFPDAQCFVSLEGVKYTLTDAGSTPLTPLNGWTGGVFATRAPSAALIKGMVHLKGTVGNGTDALLFTLPPAMRPPGNVYLSVGLCNSVKGRLTVNSAGEVRVASTTSFADAQCFTSLEGVSFAPAPAGFANLGFANGWTATPYGTATASATILRNVVYLRGAIWSGSASGLGVLPPILRPPSRVYLPVDLFAGAKGRIQIEPDGTWTVSDEGGGAIANASGFTSLDGVSYAVPEPGAWPALASGLLLLAGIESARRGRRAGRTERRSARPD